MNCAKHLEKLIFLSTLPRESYQRIYEASLAGNVLCACCQEPVKLYLGLRTKPYFYHSIQNSDLECETYCEKLIPKEKGSEPETIYEEKNGFRIPKSRKIDSDQIETETNWRLPMPSRILTPFSPPHHKHSAFVGGLPLDAEQEMAVKETDGPLLVLAGAGSGKTRVLTTRALYMIQEKNIDPKSMMLVTFTTKAAREMQDRIHLQAKSANLPVSNLVSGTFHSIFYKILIHADRERYSGDKLLKWDWQKEQYLRSSCRELGIDEKEFAFDQAIQQIGLWKNTLQTPDSVKTTDKWEEQVLTLYKRYEQQKQQNKQFDFDDMLVQCYEMLKGNENLLQQYQRRFHYFLIDEFQDINPVQYELIRLLSSHSNNLCVVGDDDQSIYGFRGSEPSFILNFKKDYPTAKVVTLSENYRSDHTIVSTANHVISKNKERLSKKMTAQYGSDLAPLFFFPFDEEEEATLILNDIQEKIRDGAAPRDFTILYRTHSAGRAVLERFVSSSIPFVIEQGQVSFYEKKMVKSLLAYLRLSVNPDDVSAIGDLIRALFLKQSVLNDLKAFSVLHDCTLLEALLKLQNLQHFQLAKLKKVVPRVHTLQTLQPLLAIATIEKELGFSDYLKKQGNEGNTIEKGSDDIKDLKVMANKFTSVREFLQHVDHMIATQSALRKSRETSTEAVQLMTIHRSKGLEFTNVYIIGAVDGSLPHEFSLDSLRKGDPAFVEEERRLLYVAMTRARKGLSISIPYQRRGRKAVASRFVKALM
ncbi:ATP-dependent helicase [Metabacillus herbersteinensis]|uniref:DNA 3'-5' helicase n=1 Tax=Metabacillus herbersteinensis TaxID=283816 RepID=A0ABV6GFD1_9BACI